MEANSHGERHTFRVLGSLEVRGADAGEPVNIGGTKPRQILATLLLKSHTMVSTELLTEILWPDNPPQSAVANIRTYVSGLRGKLPPSTDGPRIDVRPTGYRIRVHADELDLLAFGELVAQARRFRETGQEEEALQTYRRARSLWAGEPLADLPTSPAWESELAQLTGMWFAAEEDRLSLLASAGQFETVVDEARGMLVEHPFREQLWYRLIEALDRSGREAEALSAYADIRQQLREHLGVEPGRELRLLYERMLGQSGTFPVRQLPSAVVDFTGRTQDLPALAETLCGQDDSMPGVSPVVVIVGPPGVGKTTLAVQTAHRIRDHFPDGQLFLDLAGTTSTSRSPSDLLAELLVGLGISGSAMPSREAERAAMFRSRIADRRVLIVLDNASNTAQVRPLLPATDGCAVLVTSRQRLSELPAASRLDLDVLSASEADQLLAKIAGARRVSGEPVAAREISTACGRLPLAIRMAGARLAGRQGWALEMFADRLRDSSRRLSELATGDSGVRASFDVSLRQLDPSAVRLFRRLGLLTAQPQPEWVLVALMADDDGTGSESSVDEAIDGLLEANLLRTAGTDLTGQPLYHMHDLLWAYATDAVSGEPADERRAIVSRVLGGWLSLMEAAVTGLPVSLTPLAPGKAPRYDPGERVSARVAEASGKWFDAERSRLISTIHQASGHGLDELVWELAVALEPYLDLGSHHEAWIASYRYALEAVRKAGNIRGEAVLLRALGQVLIYEDSCAEAVGLMRRSYERFRSIGDAEGAALAYAGVGAAYRVAGKDALALRVGLRVIPMLARNGQRQVESQTRGNMGLIMVNLGMVSEAEKQFTEALRLARELGDRHREANVLRRYSELAVRRGEPREALAMLRPALDIFDELDDRRCGAYALQNAGKAQLALADFARARVVLSRALASYRVMGDRRGEASCSRLLGEIDLRQGDREAAQVNLSRAIELWREIEATAPAEEAENVLAGLTEAASVGR